MNAHLTSTELDDWSRRRDSELTAAAHVAPGQEHAPGPVPHLPRDDRVRGYPTPIGRRRIPRVGHGCASCAWPVRRPVTDSVHGVPVNRAPQMLYAVIAIALSTPLSSRADGRAAPGVSLGGLSLLHAE
jgi:hypothetical protein